MNKIHQDMRKGHKVAVFLSTTLTNELDMDKYLTNEFAKDFSFEIDFPAGPEATAESSSNIRDLIKGFSNSSLFMDKVVDFANKKGIASASGAVIFYGFEYDESLINIDRSHKLEFLGTFDY